MSPKIVPDTSIIIDGKLSYLIEKGDIEEDIVIPEFVVDELENQANEGKETGYKGIEEIKKIRMLAEREGIGLEFKGRKPTTEEIEMAHAGRIDALIRDMAEDMDAVLYTADQVQAKVARAKGIEVKQFERENNVEFSLEDYFDDKTMSVHLKEGTTPKAKRGLPGEFKLEQIGEEKLTRDEMYDLINETMEKAEVSNEGLVEMEEEGATVIQLGPYRIAMTRPPFSEAAEITAVRPVAKVSLDDYEMSDKLLTCLKTEAEGILVAGAPGHGKSTFSQALAEYYKDQGKIVKTMEKPRDLDVSEDITQYTALDDSMENTGDFLLLARPDYTVFDEVRKTDDFEVFSDMRMAGVGMIGVVHASEAVDAVQRLIGRVELGMIPQVCDTVVFIRDAQIAEVYKIELTVKVPEGMTEEDLARPVIQISRFEDDSPQYEIYTYGEETVVVPVSAAGGRQETGTQKLAKEQLQHYFKQYADHPRIEFLSDNHIQVEVDEDDIAHIIGKGGKNIDNIEDELGLNVTVEPKQDTLKSDTDYHVDERGNSVIIAVGDNMSGSEVDIYDDDEFLFAATVGKNGEISLTKQSDLAGRVLGAAERGSLKVRS